MQLYRAVSTATLRGGFGRRLFSGLSRYDHQRIMLEVPGTKQAVGFEDWILDLVYRFGRAEMKRI